MKNFVLTAVLAVGIIVGGASPALAATKVWHAGDRCIAGVTARYKLVGGNYVQGARNNKGHWIRDGWGLFHNSCPWVKGEPFNP